MLSLTIYEGEGLWLGPDIFVMAYRVQPGNGNGRGPGVRLAITAPAEVAIAREALGRPTGPRRPQEPLPLEQPDPRQERVLDAVDHYLHGNRRPALGGDDER